MTSVLNFLPLITLIMKSPESLHMCCGISFVNLHSLIISRTDTVRYLFLDIVSISSRRVEVSTLHSIYLDILPSIDLFGGEFSC